MIEAEFKQQAQQPTGGGVPGSFLIPGTNTSIKLGGYVKLDAEKDSGQNPGDFIFFNAITPNTNATGNRKDNLRFDARQSRFNIQSFTPSGYGTLHTYIEGDFYGTSPSSNAVTREGDGAHVNLVWSPVPNSNIGIEYARAHREFENRTFGDVNRFQASALLAF